MTTATEQVIDRELEVGPSSELSVNNISGRVDVRGADTSHIRIHAVKHGRESAIENTRIEIEQNGNRVTVRTRADENGWLNITRSMCSVQYEIEVPRDCHVEVRCVSADITAGGLESPLKIENVSGDVRIDDLLAACSVTSVSGDVEARGIEGKLSLRSTSGDANISNSRIPDFNCHTVSGDLTIETPLTPGEHYYAKTVSGDLHLLVPAGTGATVQMKSISGDVVSDLPAQIIKSGRRHWQGVINGGGANVEMATVSGDLRVSVSGTLEPVENPGASDSVTARTGVSTENATAILEELERGEISVEDALGRLKAQR